MFEFYNEEIYIATETINLISVLSFPKQVADAYSEFSQISKMKCLTKKVSGF